MRDVFCFLQTAIWTGLVLKKGHFRKRENFHSCHIAFLYLQIFFCFLTFITSICFVQTCLAKPGSGWKKYKSSTFTSDFVKRVCDFSGSDLPVLSEPLPLTVNSDTSAVSAPSHEIARVVSPHAGSEVGDTLDCI